MDRGGDGGGVPARLRHRAASGSSTCSGSCTPAPADQRQRHVRGTAWTDLDRVMLMGGFNGAGCDTAEASTANTKVCHVRLFPSGTDTINWTRDRGRGERPAPTATSTVMVVEWGSEWTVQRVRVTGIERRRRRRRARGVQHRRDRVGSPGRDLGLGHRAHQRRDGIGNAAEGVVVTLGDGVNQNATETTRGRRDRVRSHGHRLRGLGAPAPGPRGEPRLRQRRRERRTPTGTPPT